MTRRGLAIAAKDFSFQLGAGPRDEVRLAQKPVTVPSDDILAGPVLADDERVSPNRRTTDVDIERFFLAVDDTVHFRRAFPFALDRAAFTRRAVVFDSFFFFFTASS